MARLTKREKELIRDMIGMAQAGLGPGEGDYQEWTEQDFERLDNIALKLSTQPMKQEH